MEYLKVLKRVNKTSENAIFKARHILTNKVVALKEIKQISLDEGVPATAIREISLLKELKHRNIARLQNVLMNQMTTTLVFEYVPMDLKTYMQRLPRDFILPPPAIQSYLHQIASGVAFCHQRRVFHRNLCPQNILITRQGIIKITKFDSARSFEMDRKVYTHNVTVLWYRSPEVLLGTSKYTHKIDIWSIGCIFAEMFLHKPLFQGDSEISQMYKIADVLGNPTKITWPGVEKLPYYFSGLQVNEKNGLKATIKCAKNIEIHLMKQMFKFNPVDRISAKRILKHQYFLNFNANLRIPTII